jgi:hypothetical protein
MDTAHTVSGPFRAWSYPYGYPTIGRREWYVSVPCDPSESTLGLDSTCLGCITNFDGQPRRYVISNTWPIPQFLSLKAAIQSLLANHNHDEEETCKGRSTPGHQ